MTKIITVTEVQRNIGNISEHIADNAFVVTRNGKGSVVMLPYFDGCDVHVADYLEDFEMMQNKEVLQKRYRKSSRSGASSLVV